MDNEGMFMWQSISAHVSPRQADAKNIEKGNAIIGIRKRTTSL